MKNESPFVTNLSSAGLRQPEVTLKLSHLLPQFPTYLHKSSVCSEMKMNVRLCLLQVFFFVSLMNSITDELLLRKASFGKEVIKKNGAKNTFIITTFS